MGKGTELLTTLVGLGIMVALCVILITFIGRASSVPGKETEKGDVTSFHYFRLARCRAVFWKA